DGSDKEYPELEDILGRPASSFEELLGQLDTLVKHPRPPRNYGDALAKEELRRMDYRDLSVGGKPFKSGKTPEPRAPLRQRPRNLRYGQYATIQSAADEGAQRAADADESQDGESSLATTGPGSSGLTDTSPETDDRAINLAMSPEDREQQRIAKKKIAGFRKFRANMMSMDLLLEGLEKNRAAESKEEQGASEPGSKEEQSVSEPIGEEEQGVSGSSDAPNFPVMEEDRDFEKLLRQSWELFDEDLASSAKQKSMSGGAEPAEATGAAKLLHKPSNAPPGARSFHTSRQVQDAKGHPKSANSSPRLIWKGKKAGPRQFEPIGSPQNPRATEQQGGGSLANMVEKHISPKSLIKKPRHPTHVRIRKHISTNMTSGEYTHVAHDATVDVGDIIELRLDSGSIASPHSLEINIGGVILKTTGRYHFAVLFKDGTLTGSRERTIGFVAKGAMFDEEFLRKSKVSKEDIERIRAYKRHLEEQRAVHGKALITSASVAAALQTAARNMQEQPKRGGLFDSAQPAAPEENADLSLDDDPVGRIALGAKPAENEDGEESIVDVMTRVHPTVVREFSDRAVALLRSRYREFHNYWGMAIEKGQKRVTVDSLAMLIFGARNGKPISEEVRLASYIHLVQNPLQFIPDATGLFVTNSFVINPKRDVERVQTARDWIRGNTPEFTSFVEKARKLIAHAFASDPVSPHHTALSPDAESMAEMLKCKLSGWDGGVDVPVKEGPPPSKSDILSANELKEITFNKSDQVFIGILRNYIYGGNVGYELRKNPYADLAPFIIKKLGRYNVCSVTSVTRALVDLGVWPHWYNPKLDTRFMGVGSPVESEPLSMIREKSQQLVQRYLEGSPDVVDGAADETASAPVPQKLPWRPDPKESDSIVVQSSSGTGIIDKTKFYGRDICEEIRHDFGDLPVYTIDDAATTDVDDGVSIEVVQGVDGEPQTWIHVHVADPTAIIHPGHVVADAATEAMESLYYLEATKHMLPIDLVTKKIALARREDGSPVKTMTFSVRLGDDGDIVDYKVRPGLIRNITAVPYELIDNHLPFGLNGSSMKSLADLQDRMRHTTLIHPFTSAESSWRNYGECGGTLSDAANRHLHQLHELSLRHLKFRVNSGYFWAPSTNIKAKISLGGGSKTTDMLRPGFLMRQLQSSGTGVLEYPRIETAATPESPAHTLVAEMMVMAGRAAARHAQEHGLPSAHSTDGDTTTPFLYRVQQYPNLSMLDGCSPNMPHPFEGLSTEDSQSAEKVWAALQDISRKNHGVVHAKHYDEIRHMMNPSVIDSSPGPHTIMGINDAFGYSRVTSPIRRMDDLILHWQLKAQLLAEHGDARDKEPWFWKHGDMERLGQMIFLRQFEARKNMRRSQDYWVMAMIRRMEFGARRGQLPLPPAGFYDANSPYYADTPWAYYDPRRPGPLVWTGIIDNRDESRSFLPIRIAGTDVRAMVVPRPLDPAVLPFAGTKVRVHLIEVSPVDELIIAKVAPEEYQPPETPRFWKHPYVFQAISRRLSTITPASIGV
ncbi:3'-5' RNA exonuclease complex component, partial [Coemansia sp. RSA 552]